MPSNGDTPTDGGVRLVAGATVALIEGLMTDDVVTDAVAADCIEVFAGEDSAAAAISVAVWPGLTGGCEGDETVPDRPAARIGVIAPARVVGVDSVATECLRATVALVAATVFAAVRPLPAVLADAVVPLEPVLSTTDPLLGVEPVAASPPLGAESVWEVVEPSASLEPAAPAPAGVPTDAEEPPLPMLRFELVLPAALVPVGAAPWRMLVESTSAPVELGEPVEPPL